MKKWELNGQKNKQVFVNWVMRERERENTRRQLRSSSFLIAFALLVNDSQYPFSTHSMFSNNNFPLLDGARQDGQGRWSGKRLQNLLAVAQWPHALLWLLPFWSNRTVIQTTEAWSVRQLSPTTTATIRVVVRRNGEGELRIRDWGHAPCAPTSRTRSGSAFQTGTYELV